MLFVLHVVRSYDLVYVFTVMPFEYVSVRTGLWSWQWQLAQDPRCEDRDPVHVHVAGE